MAAVDATPDYMTSPYAAIGNGRVHYSTTSAVSPTTLLSAGRRSRDVGAYSSDALPPFYDRRDLLATTTYNRRSVAAPTPDGDTPPVEVPRSRLQFIHALGCGLFGDVSDAKQIIVFFWKKLTTTFTTRHRRYDRRFPGDPIPAFTFLSLLFWEQDL